MLTSFSILNDEKIRVEFDYKQRSESAALKISNIELELESALNDLEEKY